MSREVGQTPPSSSQPQRPERDKRAEGSLQKRKVVWEQGQVSPLQRTLSAELRELGLVNDYHKFLIGRKLSGENLTERVSQESSHEASIDAVARTSLQLPASKKGGFTAFQHVINEMVSTEATFSEAILPLADAYIRYREDFEQMMDSFGFSKLETAFLFGHVLNAASSIHTMQIKLEEVKRLSEEGRGLEAMNQLSQFIETHYPAYIDALKEGLLVSEVISKRITGDLSNKMAAAFEQFFVTHGLQKPSPAMRAISPRLITIVQRPTRWNLLFESATNKLQKLSPKTVKISINQELLEARKIKNDDARDARIAEIMTMEELVENGNVLPVWERASVLMGEMVVELNEYARVFGAVVDADDLIKQTLLSPMQSEWIGSLFNANGIDEKMIEGLNTLYNEYGQSLRPLREGKIAVDRESDINQKRLLRKELTQKAKSQIPSLNKLSHSFNTLGGLLPLESLADSIQQLQVDLQQEIGSKKENDPELGKLKEKLEALQELNVDLQKMMSVLKIRFNFANQIYRDLHLIMETDGWKVEKKLIKGPIGNDPLWKQFLSNQGIAASDLRKFNQIYKQYFSALEPFYLAVEALKEDPTNLELQQQLQKVTRAQESKINKAYEAIRKWGDTPKLRQLDSVIDGYRKQLTQMASQTTDLRERTEIKHKLSLLPETNFHDEIMDSRTFFFTNL